MSRRVFVFAFLLAGLGVSAPALAQETQVALDEAGRVMEVDRPLARRLGLFLDDYPELRVVRLYRVDEASYVLEVTAQREGQTVRERVPMTAGEVASLRARVTTRLAEHAPALVLDQEGRFLLLGTTTLLGLGFYGWALPVALDIDDGRLALATYMFTAAGSFVVPFLYTRDRPVTYGMANAGFWGATRGLTGGLYLAELVDQGRERTAVGFGLVGSLGAGLAMYDWARRTDMSAGDAHVIGNYGDFGHAWALSSMLIGQPNDGRAVAAAALAGGGAGLAAGAWRAPRLPYTWGDAEVQRGGFYLGMYNGLALWALLVGGDQVSEGEERLLGAMLLGGSLGGLHAADRLLVGHDFTAGQGILVNLGTVAGGLLGLGMGVLVAGSEGDDARVFLTLSALGANAGFGLTYLALSDDARRNAERRPSPLEVGFNPAGLFGLLGDERPGSGPASLPIPLLSVRYRF